MNHTPKTILVVDDDENSRIVLKSLLEESYHVDAVKTGSECLAYVNKTQPDLIILDVMMPELDGDEACYNIKRLASTRSIPVILVSSLTLEEYESRFGDSLADAFLSKPVDGSALLNLTQKFL